MPQPENDFISLLFLFFIDLSPTISPMCEVSLEKENTILENHENYIYSSLDTSSKGILVLEDPIIECHENLVCLSPAYSGRYCWTVRGWNIYGLYR